MSHIDEGALHAYLDGALDSYPAAEATRIREHLESCAACAARLVYLQCSRITNIEKCTNGQRQRNPCFICFKDSNFIIPICC